MKQSNSKCLNMNRAAKITCGTPTKIIWNVHLDFCLFLLLLVLLALCFSFSSLSMMMMMTIHIFLLPSYFACEYPLKYFFCEKKIGMLSVWCENKLPLLNSIEELIITVSLNTKWRYFFLIILCFTSNIKLLSMYTIILVKLNNIRVNVMVS